MDVNQKKLAESQKLLPKVRRWLSQKESKGFLKDSIRETVTSTPNYCGKVYADSRNRLLLSNKFMESVDLSWDDCVMQYMGKDLNGYLGIGSDDQFFRGLSLIIENDHSIVYTPTVCNSPCQLYYAYYLEDYHEYGATWFKLVPV